MRSLGRWAGMGWRRGRRAVVASPGSLRSRTLVHRVVSEEDVSASEGERLRAALAELGTTAIKFGQMLSLRPDVVGKDVADELALLQAEVPADAPGVAVGTVEAQLGKPVAELYGSFDRGAVRVGFGRPGSPGDTQRRNARCCEGVARRADAKVRADLELLEALAAFLESEDAEIARLRPTILVAEFAAMMEAAIDLREELANLQRFRLNFAGEPDVVIPEPFPEQVGREGVDDGDDGRPAVHRSGQRRKRRGGTSRCSCAGPPTCTWR